MLLLRIIGMFVLYNNVLANMEGYVVGGDEVAIEDYPHSAFLDISCASADSSGWICGASIINQHFTLTAAHCLEFCTRNGYIAVSVGHKHRHRGLVSSAHKVKTHKDYDDSSFYGDIGLVSLKTPLELGPKIQRAILMKNPPREDVAYVAGWGLVDEYNGIQTNWLKHVEQPIWSNEKCRHLLGDIPYSSICAGTQDGRNYAAVGDSGSALVIRGHIQIGIVSFKIPRVTSSLAVYTSVAYYYDWILKSTAAMACGK